MRNPPALVRPSPPFGVPGRIRPAAIRRAVGAVGAMVVTALMLWGLGLRPVVAPGVGSDAGPAARALQPGRATVTMLLLVMDSPSVPPEEVLRGAGPRAIRASGSAESKAQGQPFQQGPRGQLGPLDAPAVSISAPAVSDVAVAAAVPSPAASEGRSPPARLDLGPAVVGQAVAQSRSEWRRMADASGAYVGEPEQGEAQRLARGAEQAVKPDCVRPGAGLLSSVVRLYELAADKCRNR